MSKKKEDMVNAVDEKIEIKLTEWEFDTICQLIMGVQFPATHVDIANSLIQKLRLKHKELEKANGVMLAYAFGELRQTGDIFVVVDGIFPDRVHAQFIGNGR